MAKVYSSVFPCSFALPKICAHAYAQVIGKAALEVPGGEPGAVSGILIKRAFDYHLVHPDELLSALLLSKCSLCFRIFRCCVCISLSIII